MGIARAGFVCFGEINTPRAVIVRKAEEAKKLLAGVGIELVATDPVSDDAEGMDVARAQRELAGKDFDLLILCVAGWIPSHAVISVLSPFRHKHLLLWGLAGWTEGGKLVSTADQAGTSALRKPMEDMGLSFRYYHENWNRPPDMERIVRYARACRAVRLLEGARIGQMGYRDMNLYGTMFDGVSLRTRVGVEMEFVEMLEMVQDADRRSADKAGIAEIEGVIARMRKDWKFHKEPDLPTLRKGVAWYLAIRDMAKRRNWLGLSLIDVNGFKKLLGFPPSMIFSLLSEDPALCTVPENDSLGAVTQVMLRALTGENAPYLEFYEFMEDRLLMGVPDYVPRSVVDGDLAVLPSKFGDFGEGLLGVSKVRTGRVTLCRLTSSGDRYAMHLVTGEAVAPRPWEECGWAPPAPQLPSVEVILDGSVEDFAQKVMSQHYIVAYGDRVAEISELCRLLCITVI